MLVLRALDKYHQTPTTDTMAPSKVSNAGQTNGSAKGKLDIDSVQLEKLFIRDADVFQTTLDSEDYLDSLAPLIKDALKANALSEFIGKLNDIVKQKDSELNDISLGSARDINKCIKSIDGVSQESASLSKTMQHVNNYLNKSAFELVARKKALIKSKETTGKVNETIMTLNLCNQVLEINNKILELIKQQKSFSALKLIDELQTIHLPKVKDFSFSVKIVNSIPHMTNMIKEESFESLKMWLTTHLERKIDRIGDLLYENLYKLDEHWESLRNDSRGGFLLPHRLNSPIEVSMRDPELAFHVFESEELGISLNPIYDCILVYNSLKDSSTLSGMYHKEWMEKYRKIIHPITLSATKSYDRLPYSQEPSVLFPDLNSLETYLRKISAFFVADKELNTRTKFELRSNTTSDDLWESYVLKLKPVLLNFLNTRKWLRDDLDLLSNFKECLGHFLQVMENSQFKITELYEIMIIIFRDYFGPILIEDFRLEFMTSIQSDHYMPLGVSEREDYDNVMKLCWYRRDASFAPKNVKSMPISFPFSEDYVHYCLGIRTLMQDILDFVSRQYNYDLNEINRIIVEEIFERVLGDEPGVGICNDIKEFISKNSGNKEIVVQSFSNLEYYVYSLYEIGKLLDSKLRRYNGIGIMNIDTNSIFKLRAIELFTSVRKFSEDTIFSMVDQKLAELVDSVEYDDWYPATPNSDPNFFILDFSLFLENMFNSIFSNLPSSFKTLGLFRSYDFISEHFLNILVNARGFNKIAIQNFDLDVRHLELSMARLADSGNTDEQGGSVALQSTFAELRQTIDMLLLDDYEEFKKNASFRMRRFDRLKYETAVGLVKKMKRDVDADDDEAAVGNDTAGSISSGLERENSVFGHSAAKFQQWRLMRRNDNHQQ